MIRKRVVIYRGFKFKRCWFDPRIHDSVCSGVNCGHEEYGCEICSSDELVDLLGLIKSLKKPHYSYYYVS